MTQPGDSGPVDPGRVRRWRELLASERDAAALYSRLAEAETGERRKILAELADVERRHAAHWEGKLAEAQLLADRIMADRKVALDTLAREELGLDPGALGSPWSAAISSLLTFALGAFVVVVPYLAGSGAAALVTAIVLAAVALFAVGAGIGALNGRPVLRSGLRQLLFGGVAAAVTFGVGHLIGTAG